MPVGQPTPSTPTYLGRVITCDPTQRIVEVVLNASGQRLEITTTPVCARWPMVGEIWTVCFVHNTPYLGEPYQVYQVGASSLQTGIEEIPAGDAWINSPTGIIHVIGSADGSTDFDINLSSFSIRGSTTLVAGTAVVTEPSVTANSLIFLTPQDNNTTGALRISARSIGVSFTITSTVSGDHGRVGYQIWDS